eukprot:6631275-Prymnesium_polylepis.1
MIAALLAVSSFVPVVQHGAARTWRSHRQPTMIEAYGESHFGRRPRPARQSPCAWAALVAARRV